MRDLARAMGKIAALLDPLSPADQHEVVRALNRHYGGPLAPADRMKALRERRNSSDEKPVTQRDAEIVTPVTKRTKVSSSYLSFPGFCSFWKFYPKRVGKGEAFRSWKKQELETKTPEILEALEKQNGYLNREGGKFIPLPATWLNQQRWEDEPTAEAVRPSKRLFFPDGRPAN